MENLMQRLYAILFVAGEEGVQREALAKIVESPLYLVDQALEELKEHLAQDDISPLQLVNYHHTFRLLTTEAYQGDLEKFAQSSMSQSLSRAAIETLAIIAYRQPITRMEIDSIRGVSSQAMVQKLLARDLIKEVGRIEAPGRPVLYGVTPYFMNYFALESLEDLPSIQPLTLANEAISESLFSAKEWEIEWYEEES